MNERISDQRSGFTLIELLVALAITAMIATFAIAGVTLALRGFSAATADNTYAQADAAAARLRLLVSQTKPATTIDPDTGLARLLFRGHKNTIDFVTLSEGFAQHGGLIRIQLIRHCVETNSISCPLELRTAVYRSDPAAIALGEPINLSPKVTKFWMRYFGPAFAGQSQQWHEEWLGRDYLPRAVELNIEFDHNDKKETLSLIVPLRHSSP
jgi:prepilin-type N-terminal cleavage/methylation domain-containing protein